MPSESEVKGVRDAFAALARSFKRVSVYRHARDQHVSYLEPAAVEFRSLLELQPTVTVSVEPTALVYQAEAIYTEPARETGFCFRLHRDGVRSLTFRRGVGVEELLSLAMIALADPAQEGGHEDAVTELWKSDLSHVPYTAIPGYRMDEAGGATVAGTISDIAARAQQVIDTHVGEQFVEMVHEPIIWNDDHRARRDPNDNWPDLARRAALTILPIVGPDAAGWDLDAVREML